MKSIQLRFSFASYWQAASGRGSDEVLDSVVARGVGGLPIVPGRTVKGLLRDAYRRAAACGMLAHDNELQLFGSSVAASDSSQSDADAHERALDEGRFRTEPGALAFGSATLSTDWQRWATTDPASSGAVDELYARVSSTAVSDDTSDRSGLATDHTLRVFEVAVPMDLVAVVDGPDDGAWVNELKQVVPLLRALGARRNRGYGRVSVTVEESTR